MRLPVSWKAYHSDWTPVTVGEEVVGHGTTPACCCCEARSCRGQVPQGSAPQTCRRCRASVRAEQCAPQSAVTASRMGHHPCGLESQIPDSRQKQEYGEGRSPGDSVVSHRDVGPMSPGPVSHDHPRAEPLRHHATAENQTAAWVRDCHARANRRGERAIIGGHLPPGG